MSTKLRVGVVGVGYLGKFHARIYASLPDVELVGVVDADPDTAARVAAEYQCAPYAKPEDLLGKVDAVSIVVPTIYHLAAAVGVRYIVEDPLSGILTNVRGTENVLALACKYWVPVVIASSSEVYLMDF